MECRGSRGSAQRGLVSSLAVPLSVRSWPLLRLLLVQKSGQAAPQERGLNAVAEVPFLHTPAFTASPVVQRLRRQGRRRRCAACVSGDACVCDPAPIARADRRQTPATTRVPYEAARSPVLRDRAVAQPLPRAAAAHPRLTPALAPGRLVGPGVLRD